MVPAGREAADGEIVEVNEAARAWVAALAHRVVQAPGAALLIDYGPMRSAAGDSLQAIADKRMVTPLSVPGSADLTAHVDFADLVRVAEAAGAAVRGPVTQARFLAELGLLQRTENLARQRADKQQCYAMRHGGWSIPGPWGNFSR